MTLKRILVTSLLVVLCENVKLPSNFVKCNRKQPDLKECVFKAAQNGVSQLTKSFPEVNLPSLDPFELSEVSIGSGKGTVAVEQKFKKVKFYGFPNLKFNQFEFDFDKKYLSADLLFPELKLTAEYELDGKVLLLPIKGKGPSDLVLKNLKASGGCSYEEVSKRGKTYAKILECNIYLDPELITFNFENLFDGDKQLGDNINRVLNENWKEVFEDVKDGYTEVIKRIIKQLLNNFFSKVSFEEAFD